jgi:hypothetical protein
MLLTDGTGPKGCRHVTADYGRLPVPTPDCTGNYRLTSSSPTPGPIFSYLVRNDSKYVIFYSAAIGKWILAATLGDGHLWPGNNPANRWEADSMDGAVYSPVGDYVGNPVVNAWI